MQLERNPIIQANKIKKDFTTYIKSTFQIRNPEYNKLFIDELNNLKDNLYKGPYLCSSLPFIANESFNDLIENGVLNPNFVKLGGIDNIFNRKLYLHQVEAIKKVESGRSVVITTGTGSGKTECFLYPILDTLLKEIDAAPDHRLKSGIRAILLFPMNALVNDQIDRLRKLISPFEEIKFGFYTGETPEDKNDRERMVIFEGTKFPKNEIITRDEMRNNPPQILFTNYSMLEYLLLRPTEYKLISKESLKYWKFVVLDEAHTYRGTKGIEISLLLRRLIGRAKKHPQFILTSATLGRGIVDIDKIINFAKTLTSTEYTRDDIIFAKRSTVIYSKESYIINEDDYTKIYINKNDIQNIIPIFEQYLSYNRNLSLENNLYSLLLNDKNCKQLYTFTKSGCNFYDVLDKLGFKNENNLVSLIELINKSKNTENIKLFDIKYHMFIKAPDGAFISVGENKALSLNNVKTINGKKAFKIGVCPNCNTPYIIGRIVDNYLMIDDEVDIDETYAEKIRQVQYFLMADCLTDLEILDIEQNHKDEFEKYLLCPVCGSIRKNIGTIRQCNCDEDEVVVYLYYYTKDKDNEDLYSNNIKECPICGYTTKFGGVVMGFHIGKDRATALIAQILYNAMDYPRIKVEENKKSLFASKDKYVNGVKQFIAFSDARQQASFFNKFFNMNDRRFLYKALIWNVISNEENDNRPMSYDSVIINLMRKFLDFTNFNGDENEATIEANAAALNELLLIDGNNSAEGLGLFAFRLKLPQEYYDDEKIEKALQENGFGEVNAEQFRTITKVLLEIFRTAPAIAHDLQSLDYEKKEELLSYRKFCNYIQLVKTVDLDKNSKDKLMYAKSFLPTRGLSDNKVTKYLKKCFFNWGSIRAKEFAQIVYETAIDTKIVKTVGSVNAQQIDSSNYELISYKDPNIKFYYCSKCKRVTMYNVKGTCPHSDCDGKLVECKDLDKYFQNNYYRNEYKTRPLERVISKEHTAQIKASNAKQIQNDFKDKKINIISCSTTFEMGIDIGSLNTVFMRNVPPLPANYIQRAGRAGRQADTAAFILTFCSISSHDYTFFNNPLKMISGEVVPPFFKIDNKKIIIRHITASALALYFRNNIAAFDSAECFINDNHLEKFFNFINGLKSFDKYHLGDYIDNWVLCSDNLIKQYGNYQWVNYLKNQTGSALINMVDGIKSLEDLYNSSIKQLNEERPSKYHMLVENYENKLNKFKERNSIIDNLSRYSVIPRYGFPVDTVELKIFDIRTNSFNNDYDLSRDLTIALSEYAPGSEVIVDDKKYTSRYLYTPLYGVPQSTSYYVRCPKCKRINISEVKDLGQFTKCKYCGESLVGEIFENNIVDFIKPINGFVTDKRNRYTRKLKPARTYASNVEYVGNGIDLIYKYDIYNVIRILQYKNEEFLILNSSNFFTCPKCGFTVVDNNAQTPKITYKHDTWNGDECLNTSLEKVQLGHTFRTDIIRVEFNNVVSMCDYDSAISTLYAILEGISYVLEIERNEIDGLVEPETTCSNIIPYSFIIYDNIPGGAGFVKRLTNKETFIEVLNAALDKVSQACCGEDTSCYNCLRNFKNQQFHNHLIRGKARNTLEDIIHQIYDSATTVIVEKVVLDLKDTNLENFFKSGYIEDDECINILIQLFNNVDKIDYPKYGITIKSSDGEEFYADFLWNNNILLFTLENLDDYIKLKSSQNTFECIFLDEKLNIGDFINKIKKN